MVHSQVSSGRVGRFNTIECKGQIVCSVNCVEGTRVRSSGVRLPCFPRLPKRGCHFSLVWGLRARTSNVSL